MLSKLKSDVYLTFLQGASPFTWCLKKNDHKDQILKRNKNFKHIKHLIHDVPN